MSKTYAFDDPRPDASDVPLDLFGSRCAQHQRAARVNGCQEGVAVFETMLEVSYGRTGLVENPF